MCLTLKKIRITFDYITVAFICIIIILGNDTRYLTAILCTVIHEGGHIAVMLKCGCEYVDVKVNLFNISIFDKRRTCRPYKDDFLIICAGPLANIITAAAAWIAYKIIPFEIFYSAAMISIFLAVFNLLPMESTDGGQLLTIFLCRHFSSQTVRKIMTVLTLTVLIPIASLGFYITLRSRYNYTLLVAALYFAALAVMKKTKFL